MAARVFAPVALAAVALTGARAADSVGPIVERTGRSVQQFEQDFITVIADETYDQFTTDDHQGERAGRVDLSGEFWTRQSDGAVLRTRMKVIAAPDGRLSGITTIVTVEYVLDARLRMMVPARMDEQYLERDGDQRIEGTAVYTNYRVFETSGRVVTR